MSEQDQTPEEENKTQQQFDSPSPLLLSISMDGGSLNGSSSEEFSLDSGSKDSARTSGSLQQSFLALAIHRKQFASGTNTSSTATTTAATSRTCNSTTTSSNGNNSFLDNPMFDLDCLFEDEDGYFPSEKDSFHDGEEEDLNQLKKKFFIYQDITEGRDPTPNCHETPSGAVQAKLLQQDIENNIPTRLSRFDTTTRRQWKSVTAASSSDEWNSMLPTTHSGNTQHSFLEGAVYRTRQNSIWGRMSSPIMPSPGSEAPKTSATFRNSILDEDCKEEEDLNAQGKKISLVGKDITT